jgi:hypothetical protein
MFSHIKRSQREADHFPPTNDEETEEQSYYGAVMAERGALNFELLPAGNRNPILQPLFKPSYPCATNLTTVFSHFTSAALPLHKTIKFLMGPPCPHAPPSPVMSTIIKRIQIEVKQRAVAGVGGGGGRRQERG